MSATQAVQRQPIMQTGLQNKLREFQTDHQWIEQNGNSLLGKYPDQWIAVKHQQVIANDSDLDRLLSKLSDPAHTSIAYVGNEPIEMIL
jgi:hypothetical protein